MPCALKGYERRYAMCLLFRVYFKDLFFAPYKYALICTVQYISEQRKQKKRFHPKYEREHNIAALGG